MPSFRSLACAALLCAWAALAGPPAHPALTHHAPAVWQPNTPLRVDGNLDSSIAFSKLTLRYRGPGEDWVDAPMALQYGDLWRATIPAARLTPPGVEYYVEGVDADGQHVELFMSAAKPARVIVGGDEAAPSEKKAEAAPEKEARPERGSKSKKKKKGKKRGKKGAVEEDEEPPAAAAAKTGELEPVVDNPYQSSPDRASEKSEKAGERAERPAEKTEKPTERAERPAEKTGKPGERAERPPDRAAPKDAEKKQDDAEAPAGEKPPTSARAGAREPKASEPPRKRSELEEELAVYAAEEPSGEVTHLDDGATRSALMPSVVTQAQMRQLGARSIFDVLELLPGVTVTRDVQGFFHAGVRGLRDDPGVLFLLDGHPLNSLYDGKALANLPIEHFERLELYRGPAAAAVGLGNFVAVVNLVSRRDDGVRATASAGLWEIFDGHLDGAKTFGALKLFGDADVISQGGSRENVTKDALDTTTAAEGLRGPSDPAGRTLDQRLLVSAGLGGEYAAGFGTLRAHARFLQEDRSAYVGEFDTVGNASRLSWQTILAGVEWERPLKVGTLRAKLLFDQQATDRLFQLTPSNYRVTPQSSEVFPEGLEERQTTGVRAYRAEVGGDFDLFSGNRLTASLGGDLQQLYSYSYTTNYDPKTNAYTGPALSRPDGLSYPFEQGAGAPARRLTVSASAEDRWTPIAPLTLELGVRLDLVQLVSATNGVITGPGFAVGVGPRVGVAFTPLDALALKASYGRSFRAPTVQELTETVPDSDIDQGRTVGFGGLQPAYVDQVEAGFEYAQTIAEARLKLRGVGFFENFTNPITSVDTTGNLVPYANRAGRGAGGGRRGRGAPRAGPPRLGLGERELLSRGGSRHRAPGPAAHRPAPGALQRRLQPAAGALPGLRRHRAGGGGAAQRQPLGAGADSPLRHSRLRHRRSAAAHRAALRSPRAVADGRRTCSTWPGSTTCRGPTA